MPLSQLDFASAFEAARAIRKGEVSSAELTTRVLKRIERYNPQVNAVVTVLWESATWNRVGRRALFLTTSIATLVGLPATAASVGMTLADMPVGIQIIGPYLEDATPIELAGQLADIMGGFTPPKGFEDSV